MANIGSSILPSSIVSIPGTTTYLESVNQLVVANVVTDYVAYTVPAGKTLAIYQVDCSTTSTGILEITVDGDKIMSATHGHGNSNSSKVWALPRKVNAGQEVKVSFDSRADCVSDLDVYLMASLI